MFVFRFTIIVCFFLDHIYAEETTKFPCLPCSVCNEEVTACDFSPNCVYNLTTEECQPKIIKPQDACCLKKEVGGKKYTFLMDEDTSPYNCMNNCVYTEDGNPSSKVCFKEGDLATKCAPDSETYPPLCWPCSECNDYPEKCHLSEPFCRYNSSSGLCIGFYPKTELYPPICDPCSTCDDSPQLCWRAYPYCLYDPETMTCDARFTDTATYQTSCDPCSQCDNEPSRCLRSFPACDYDFEDNTCVERYTETNIPPCNPCSECNGEPLKCFESYPVCEYDPKDGMCRDRFTDTNPLPCDPCSNCDNDPEDCLRSFPHCFYDGKNKTCQEGTNTDVVLCAGLGVSTTIGEQVSGDVTFTCDGVLVNVFFQLPANGFKCVTAPAGHNNCNRGDNVDADKPYTCSKALDGATPFVTIKKVVGQNACTIS